MKNRKLIKTALLSLTICAVVYSCQKEEKIDTETQSAVDNTVAEQAFSQTFPLVNEIGVNDDGVGKTYGMGNNTCATVTILSYIADTTTYPDSVLIDYGVNGCLDKDSRLKKGKIYLDFSDRWKNAGANVVATFVDFSIDLVKYEGKMTVSNDGNYTFTRKIEGGKCSTADWSILYDANHSVQQTEGFATDTIVDDVYKFTGSSNGTNRNGKTYTTVISTPLISRKTCKYIESGVFEITPQDLPSRIVNYGDGTCDSKATVTINGNVYNFDLK